MNILVASDIHGSAFYCRKLISLFYHEAPDTLLLVGDILSGSDYEDVADMLNRLNEENRILSVRGNCDSEMDQKILTFPIMAEFCLLYVKNRMIFATHGHNKLLKPRLSNGDIFLQGHSHVPAWEYEKGRFYFNPGSVSMPRRGSTNSYMTITDDAFFWKNLDGKVYNEFRLS